MSRALRIALIALAAFALFEWWSTTNRPVPPEPVPAPAAARATDAGAARYPAFLPPEAIETLRAIERGGPHPYARDGVVFQNREQRLPGRPRGYYREYTVETPGAGDRGARRIVAGGDPPEVFYYTDDHYRTFRRVEIER